MKDKSINIVLSAFGLNVIAERVRPWGEGHIHETFRVETGPPHPDYILQKINHRIFRDIPGMMQNIEASCSHLRGKLSGMPGHDPGLEALSVVYTIEGNSFFKDGDGDFWRAYIFIPDTVTYQTIPSPPVAFEAGRAIGSFQALLADLGTPLVVTLPDFHDINFRISQYSGARLSGNPMRAETAAVELLFAEERFAKMSAYFSDLQRSAVIRPTHNDTKLNNILFAHDGKALCLVDLDTVMPGYVHFDYGDALRTMANTAREDEQNLSKVFFNTEVYDYFTRGYLQEAGTMLTAEEKDMLAFSPKYMTFMIGLRFLTDYLNGDVYFRTHYPDHNLVRARVQFRLVRQMEDVLPG